MITWSKIWRELLIKVAIAAQKQQVWAVLQMQQVRQSELHCYFTALFDTKFQRMYLKEEEKTKVNIYGPRREKTCLRGFLQSVFQISLLSYKD